MRLRSAAAPPFQKQEQSFFKDDEWDDADIAGMAHAAVECSRLMLRFPEARRITSGNALPGYRPQDKVVKHSPRTPVVQRFHPQQPPRAPFSAPAGVASSAPSASTGLVEYVAALHDEREWLVAMLDPKILGNPQRFAKYRTKWSDPPCTAPSPPLAPSKRKALLQSSPLPAATGWTSA